MMMLNRLREETAELHREIEKDNLAKKIMDHSITVNEYKTLLIQNFVAYNEAENEIAKYLPDSNTDKTERLKADLENLGVKNLDFDLDFSCHNEAEAIGAAYVIEGSAMGGMIIGKEIRNCPSLEKFPEQQFFNGNRSNVKNWNEYLKFLRSREFTDVEVEAASNKAKETFLLFKKAFDIQVSNSY